MTWDEVIETVVGSDPGDWHRLAGAHLLDPEAERPPEDGAPYHSLAVYRPDPTISLLWGRSENKDFREKEWANRFADPVAQSVWLDVRYHGEPIFRVLMVSVDGGRCYPPLPSRTGETRSVPSGYSRLVRLVQRLTGV